MRREFQSGTVLCGIHFTEQISCTFCEIVGRKIHVVQLVFCFIGSLIITSGILLNTAVVGAMLIFPQTKLKQPVSIAANHDNQNNCAETVAIATDQKNKENSDKSHSIENDSLIKNNCDSSEVSVQTEEETGNEPMLRIIQNILSRRPMVILFINVFLFYGGLSIVYMHTVAYATSSGHSQDFAVFLMSLIGFCNILCPGKAVLGIYWSASKSEYYCAVLYCSHLCRYVMFKIFIMQEMSRYVIFH